MRFSGLSLFLCVLTACSLTQVQHSAAPSAVLEPVDEDSTQAVQDPQPQPPSMEPLLARLVELEIRGVGLEHEPEAVLEFLLGVLSQPAIEGKAVDVLYTGALNDYDRERKALTISMEQGAKGALSFIRSKVPVRPPVPQN